MAKPFQSKFQRYEPLIDALREDRFHIGYGVGEPARRQGDHIGVLHDALAVWASSQTNRAVKDALDKMRTSDQPSQTFGPWTAELVKLFKTEKKLFNHKHEIDPIVGKGTVDKLDDLLPRFDPSEELKKKLDRERREKAERTLDVVVIYDGAATFSERTDEDGQNDDIFPLERLKAQQASGRKLLRLAANTNTIGTPSGPMIARHASKIETKLSKLNMEIGKICIAGTSSGGRNALSLAAELHRRNLPVAYVAPIDAAFFPQDAKNAPNSRLGEPTNIPVFGPVLLSAGKRENFFQTFGNHSDAARGIFASNMKFNEIHGDIPGFRRRDLTPAIRAQKPKNDDDAHARACGDGMDAAMNDIASELNAV